MSDLTRRDFTRAGVAVTAALLGKPVAAVAMNIGSESDPLSFVNPELRPAARQLQQTLAKLPPFSAKTLPGARQMHFGKSPLSTVPYTKRVIPGRRGPDVTVYVINAKAGEHRPGILHTHGGGFITGSAADNIRDLQGTASALDCAIVTVEYRLAPETRWTGSLEDNYAGLCWLRDQASELGVDRSRLAVMGESAGGGHAALLAITARDRGEVPIAFQCLTYPMLDDRTGSTRMVKAPMGVLGWDASANRFGWASFLGHAPGLARSAAGGVPARTQQLAGLPPAWIGVGSIDLFVEEDLEYARRLIEAGIMTEVLVVPGAFHGFDGIAADTAIAKSFAAARLAALRRGLSSAAS